jgi:putative transposase
MQLVEKHVISKSNSRYAPIDKAAFASKNLYNAALYEIRQSFIHQGKYVSYNQMDKTMQKHEAYQGLPRKVSQQVLRQLAHDWESFFKARDAYNKDPSTFLGRPKLPKYKDKTAGRNMLVYTIQALSKPALRRGIIKLSQLGIEIRTKHQNIDQVRIIPRHGFYVVEVVYEREKVQEG